MEYKMKRSGIYIIRNKINGKVYVGEGTAKLSVKASFAELKDENLPFEKSVFASAVKKSLQDGISKI